MGLLAWRAAALASAADCETIRMQQSARDLHRTLKRGGGIRFVRSAVETTRSPAVVRFSLAEMKATRLRTTRRFIELLSADEDFAAFSTFTVGQGNAAPAIERLRFSILVARAQSYSWLEEFGLSAL